MEFKDSSSSIFSVDKQMAGNCKIVDYSITANGSSGNSVIAVKFMADINS